MSNSPSEQALVDFVVQRFDEGLNEMSEFRSLWNEWSAAYELIDLSKDRRPKGMSKNMVAEVARATNALATSITRMQTAADPHFELRSTGASEEELFDLEKKYSKHLQGIQFKDKLLKGNRGLVLMGTGVWETSVGTMPWAPELGPVTDFQPLSMAQTVFEPKVYDIRSSSFIAPFYQPSSYQLRFMCQSGEGIWHKANIEEAIAAGATSGSDTGQADIDTRRANAGYQNSSEKEPKFHLILFSGRVLDANKNETILEMWKGLGRTDDPNNTDITIGILNRKWLVRLNPTPNGTWHHMYKIGHYIHMELQPFGIGVGRLAMPLQKDMVKLVRLMNDVAKFSLGNMYMAGRGSGLKSQNMNVIPWSVIPVDDIKQILRLEPQTAGVEVGLKLLEMIRSDLRSSTHATDTLQANVTGATATEASLAQSEALRAVSLIAEVLADTVLRPFYYGMHRNAIDLNPYDETLVPDLEFIAKLTTDKDYKPEYSKLLLNILQVTTSIKSVMPLDYNPMPIMKYLVRSAGINPREIKEPRPQVDVMTDIMRRVNGGGSPASGDNALAGEVESAGMDRSAFADTPAPIPSPASGSVPMGVY